MTFAVPQANPEVTNPCIVPGSHLPRSTCGTQRSPPRVDLLHEKCRHGFQGQSQYFGGRHRSLQMRCIHPSLQVRRRTVRAQRVTFAVRKANPEATNSGIAQESCRYRLTCGTQRSPPRVGLLHVKCRLGSPVQMQQIVGRLFPLQNRCIHPSSQVLRRIDRVQRVTFGSRSAHSRESSRFVDGGTFRLEPTFGTP